MFGLPPSYRHASTRVAAPAAPFRATQSHPFTTSHSPRPTQPITTITLIPSCPPKSRPALAARLTALEKKIFSPSEAFDYTLELKKPSIAVVLATKKTSGTSPSSLPSSSSSPKANPDGKAKAKGRGNGTGTGNGAAKGEGGSEELVGYLVFQRLKRQVWLHKLATVEAERGKGVASAMMAAMREHVGRGGAESVVLWVDEGNAVARGVYAAWGFEEAERVEGYYGEGRTGVKMLVGV